VTLSQSYSYSISKSKGVETERRVDEARVYQVEDDGTVNRNNFVDIQVPNRIKMDGGAAPAVDDSGAGSGTPGVGTGEEPGRLPEGTASEQRTDFYQPIQEKENIEVKRKNVILRNGQEWEG